MNFQDLEFSAVKAAERFNRAQQVFGKKVLVKILIFAMYLMGVKRIDASKFLDIPDESAKTCLRVLFRDGVSAFSDRRQSEVQQSVAVVTTSHEVTVRRDDPFVVIDFGSNLRPLKIPTSHKTQVRTVLLSLVGNDLLGVQECALVLGISTAHCRVLSDCLAKDDVDFVLIDKRQGRKVDYLVGSEEKAEIIKQFAARSVAGFPTTSEVLSEIVNEERGTSVSPRTIRWHIKNLGLRDIKKTLPELVETLKKNS